MFLRTRRSSKWIVVVHTPPGYTEKDEDWAKDLASHLEAQLRAYDVASCVVPPGWSVELVPMNITMESPSA